MTKHVEIWTLSKESKVVPYLSHMVEFYEGPPPADVYVTDNNTFIDRIEHRFMDVIKVSKSERVYDRLKMDSKIERLDKYIAIHPDVEEAISVKWKERVDSLETNLSWWKDYGNNLTGKLDNFKVLPWYKRVWRALTNQI